MSRPSSRLVICLAAALLATSTLTACNRAGGDGAKGKADAKVKVAPAETPFAAVANGKVDVEGGIIAVAARRGGIVREVLVQEGDQVVKGQVLARQEDDEAKLNLVSSRAQLAQVKSQLVSTEVQLAAARRELARNQQLQAKGFVAGQRIDEANDRVKQLEAQLNAQRASVAVSEANLAEATYNLELTVIRAPVDGRIIRRLANPGGGASTLNVSNMFDIEPRAPRIVRSEAPEAALSSIFVGQKVVISPESDGSRTYSGVVLRRAGLFGARRLQSDDPSERADDRVVEVVVSAENAPLLIGQRVLVKFLKPGKEAPPPVNAPARPAAPAAK